MAISSVGAGSGVLTQDILDQLREADSSQYITPLELSIANENDKKQALKIIDANMTNLEDGINALKDPALFNERSATITGTSVEVTAAIMSDIQEFTLEVTNLATKQIEQSAAFDNADIESISATDGQIELSIDGQIFQIDYTAGTTLNGLKSLINDVAGEKVDATVVQIGDTDFRLFISSVDTGENQGISITNTIGTIDPRLSDGVGGLTEIQAGTNANFKFNGQDIVRESNNVSDLIVGLDITLKEVGTSNVSIGQNRETIMEKIDSFISHYNAAIIELGKMTKSSLDSEERGIFSGDSTIRGMKSTIENMVASTTSGSMFDFGFELDRNGVLSVDKDALTTQLDDNNANVIAFFIGGTYTNPDLTTTELTGAFTEFATKVDAYTKYDATLDQFKNSITDAISMYEDRKLTATERLDSKYETLKKKFIAYDIMMSKFNSASSMFTQMANAAADSN